MAAAPDSLWSARFGGNSHDVCNAIVPTSDGGYALAGWTRSSEFHATWYDFWLVKTDGSGQIQWSKTYGGPEGEGCFALQQTSDGGFILAGMTGSFGEGESGPSDAWVVKTAANGDSMWAKKYGGALADGFYSVQLTSDGGYAFAGFTDSYGTGNRDYWLVKTDANGDSLWSQTYGAGGFDECHSLIITSDGGFALGGVTGSFRQRDDNFYLVKTDGNGVQQWTKIYGTRNDDNCYSLVQSLDGGFALAGSTVNANTLAEDFWLVRTKANGDSLWAHNYGQPATHEVCYSLQATQDSCYVLAGGSTGYGAGLWDIWMLKADPRGNIVWSRTFGGPERDNCFALAKTPDGGFALGGYTRSFGAAYEDVWQVKTGADVLITPPDPFHLLTPDDNTTFPANTFTFPFTWGKSVNHDAYDTITYRLFISDTLSFDPARTDTSDPQRMTDIQNSDTVSWTRVILANVPHYWKVQAMDMGGWVTWSTETRTFTVLGTAPNAFDLTSPADNAIIPDSFTVPFSWAVASDPDAGDYVTYTLYVSTDSTFATYDSTSGLAHSVTWTDLIVANTRTFWKVKATDHHGLSTWSSQVFSFTITAHAPNAFALAAPANNTESPDNESIVFKWFRALDADSATGDTVRYVVYCDSMQDFSTGDSLAVRTDSATLWVKALPATHQYWWKVKAYDKHGLFTWSDTWTFTRIAHEPIVQQPQDPAKPLVFKVHQNYPNPFNATTQISFDLPNAGWVTVRVFNVLGREVGTLVNQHMAAGTWRASFDGTNLPSGLYILRVEAPGVTEMKKMMLLK